MLRLVDPQFHIMIWKPDYSSSYLQRTEGIYILGQLSEYLEKAMAPHSSTFAWKIP